MYKIDSFLSRAPTCHRFTFNLYFCKILFPFKTFVEFFTSDSLLIFVQQKSWNLWLWNVISPFKIRILEKSNTFLLPDIWFETRVLKFNIICMSWSYAITDLETNFLNLKNWSFQNISFCQLSKHLTFLYFFNWTNEHLLNIHQKNTGVS